MNKNLKISFVLCLISSAVIVAWRTLQEFFGGTGISFASLIVIVSFLISLILSDKHIFARIKDLFIFLCVLTLLEMIVYFAFDFAINTSKSLVGFLVFQNIISVFGILFLAYSMFRFITELKQIQIGFVEFILGNKNYRHRPKPKKAKELTNGTLEDKPSNNLKDYSYYSDVLPKDSNMDVTNEEE